MADCGFAQRGDTGVGGFDLSVVVYFNGLLLLCFFFLLGSHMFLSRGEKKKGKSSFKFDMKIKVVAKSTFGGWH